jgi:phosphoribosylformylglycinamidine synthase
MLAHRLLALREELDAFRESGRLVIGICNGFQVLTKLGMLPDFTGDWRQEVSLVWNDHGRFEDSWVTIEFAGDTGSPWLSGLSRVDVPIRHGEGRFVTAGEETLEQLRAEHRVAARYVGRNPNGSADAIAGIVDRTGCVIGMMPHPEAFLEAQNHPFWPHRETPPDAAARLFRNAVEHVRGL